MKRQVISGIYTTDSPVLPEDMQANFDNQNVELFENPDVGQEHWFTNNTFPDHNANNCTINSVNFYDAYFDDATFESRYGYLCSHANGLPDNYLTNIKGLLTVTKTKILDNSEIDLGLSNDYLLSVNYYDRLSRIIQHVSDNHFGETLRTSFYYNFTGDLLLKKETQTKSKQAYSYTTINKYDIRKRLIESDELFQDGVYKSSFDYDELGKQKRINLLRQNGTKIQSIDHKYNMRGWLTDINNVEKPQNDLFALRLHYAQPTNPQYNGNISAAEWYSTEFGVNKYDYAYDNTNRLKSAIYSGNSSYNYNSSYDYDKNGNITNLTRFGNLGASQVCAEIDKLSYSYTGNQLIQVNDLFDDNHQNNGFKDNGTTLPIEYSYDFNGNMIEDKNKDLTVDAYNLLNLPQQLNITGTNTSGTIMQSVNYLYAANGQKLRKQTRIDHQLAATYDYAGRFVYSDLNGDDTQLSYLMANQGRIILNEDGSFGYEYAIKDHLGNTRVTFDEKGKILQEDTYYPFGMNISGLSYNQNTIQNKYKYNGKELQDEFGLDWYDYGARFYDAPIGRFHTIDPLSEEYYFQSPFVYAANNPILNIDLYGAGPWDIAKGTGLIVGGGVQWVGGIGLACTPTGVGQFVGVALIMNGSADIAWGMVVLANNGKEEIPSGPKEAIGAIVDKGLGNDNSTFAKVGAVSDFIAGLPSGSVSSEALVLAGNAASLISAISTGESLLVQSNPSNDSNTLNKKEFVVPKEEIYTPEPDNTNVVRDDALAEHYLRGTLY